MENEETPRQEKVLPIEKGLPIPVYMIAAICLLVLIIIAILILRAAPSKTTSAYDDHGCYTTAGYAWCAPKDKCVLVNAENCTKNDMASKICANGVAANTTDNYVFDEPTDTCIISGSSNTSVIWGINCESNVAKALIEVRNVNVTQAQLEQSFTGCTVTQK